MSASGHELKHPHLPIDEEWLARRQEEILEPELPIIDAHHHFYGPRPYRYFLEDFLADTNTGHNIRASVYVQCRSMYRADGPPELQPVGETEFANGVAAQSASGHYGPSRICAGIVGFADLTLGDRVEPVLEAHLQAGGGRFRGIRNFTASHPDPDLRTTPIPPPLGLLVDDGFRRGVARLGKFGMTLDVWAYHTQLHEVIDLARRFANQVIVVNHVGGPIGIGSYAGKREEVFAAWQADMLTLANCPNVFVKLGGLAMRIGGFTFHEQPLPPSSTELAAAWRPYIETCIEAFGPSRCIFESNFPVDKGMCSYPVVWNAFKRLAAGASADEKTALFSANAARVYRLAID